MIKACHFDYSGESSRDFALVINDRVDVPLYKSIDLQNVTTNNGWIVQGTISHWQVSDVMFMVVSNISRVYTGFFQVIPYGGPEITLSGYSDYDVVSNTVSIHADITDLSGITNEVFEFSVGDIPSARFSLGASNTFNLETAYSPNGLNEIKLTVHNQARFYDIGNIPDNAKIFFSGNNTLSLDFENDTFLAFASDWCPPDVGTNYIYFYVDSARHIEASISKTNGQEVATFSGDTPDATYVSLPFDFTEVDGVTPYSNNTYVVTFTASSPSLPRAGIHPYASGDDSTTITTTNTIDRDGNIRPGNGCLLTYQWDDPSDPTWSYINDKADSAIAGDLLTLYQSIYDNYSLTQYGTGDVGTNRNAAQCHPYNAQYKSWESILGQLTNYFYSELTIAQAHGSGGFLGNATYLWKAPLSLVHSL